ncbi:beta-glucosidase [bacterium]|nr:beta-glucosidase [bacterium]
MSFPKDFVWGTATSSYQIEGGGLDYGRGECIWHRFTHTEGNVRNSDTGVVACDHIHRYPEDVQLMRNMGVDAYRLSTAWARVLPQGMGAVNEQGVAFYDKLIDALLEANITPYITLYHWDLPQALQDKGGWENPDSIRWFSDYADLMTRILGDRVKNWITHNEPFVVSMVGNLYGHHAPGKQEPVAAYTVAHHVLRSHGASVSVIRDNIPDAEIGITLDQTYSVPRTDSHEDRLAARRFASWHNDWFLEPVFRGTYPADLVAYLEPYGVFEKIRLDDIAEACVAIDFLGVNYYTRNIVSHQDDGWLNFTSTRNEGAEYTLMDWEVYPDGLLHTLLYLHNAYYPPKIYITENGCAYLDPEPQNGLVDDPRRIEYYRLHIDAIHQAIGLNVPVAGYFAWSFMDNFEWGHGYYQRFGLHHVDFETLERSPKASALYYRDRIKLEKQGQ